MDLYQRNVELEQTMQAAGIKRFWDGIRKAIERGEESTTCYGLHLAKETVFPLRDAIVADFTHIQSGTMGGPKPVLFTLLQDADPQVVAFITVKTVLGTITRQQGFQNVAIAIGASLEDEVRFRQFSGERKKYWDAVVKRVESSTSNKHHKRKVLIHAMNKLAEVQPELAWNLWETADKYHVGARLIDLLMGCSNMVLTRTVTSTTGKGRVKSKTYLSATPELMDWIEGKNGYSELLFPTFLPTLIPPKLWTTPFDGGYHTEAIRPQTLVKTYQKTYLHELHALVDEMPKVYETVNAIQNTPWKINKAIYFLARQVWDDELDLGVTPDREATPLPTKPYDIDTNQDALRDWKRSAAKVHEWNAKNLSNRIQFSQMLSLAEQFEKEDQFYFPQQLDFRGRIYTIPSGLTPQGCDIAKALLCFAEGKPVGVTGLRWLQIHAANCFGEDKCSLDERVVWAQRHMTKIIACSEDSLSERWWTEADKPWQFLAACMEIHAVQQDPNYLSCLPVSVDGSCNGLQNFSAMLRDSIGGRAVNLVPQDTPNDIYARVAEVTKIKVEADAEAGEEKARLWLQFGFDRKATKRPVMTLPYGATLYSARTYVQDYIEDSGKQRLWPKEDKVHIDDFKMSVYLANHIWSSIGEVVVAAREAMDWLQRAARVAAKAELPINWRTPVGFRVQQAYRDMERYTVETKLGDRLRVYSWLTKETEKLHSRRQASGISPNFVHSMDAAALMLTVHECRKVGITCFGMVHDSYGTLAADMDAMTVCLREAFVQLYQTDVLEEFRQSILAGLPEKFQAQVPPYPPKGDLDLNAVKQSVYFFA